jgi:hypothetical protein
MVQISLTLVFSPDPPWGQGQSLFKFLDEDLGRAATALDDAHSSSFCELMD